MDFYGITMKGKFWDKEVEDLPDFSLEDIGKIIYVTSTDEMYYGGSSSWKRYFVEEEELNISTPIVSLFNGDQETLAQPLKLISTPFQSINGVDIHKSTLWRIYESDGETLVWENLDSINLTSVFLPLNTLASDTQYILSVIYNGENQTSLSSSTAITTPVIENTIDVNILNIGDYFEGGYYAGSSEIDGIKNILLVAPKSTEVSVLDAPDIIPSTTLYNKNATYDSVNYSFSSYNGTINNFVFSDDGTKLFLNYSTSVYTFSLSTPWIISSVSYVRTTTLTYGGLNIFFRRDGKKFYATSTTMIYEYNVATPWDLSTLSYVGSKSLTYTIASFTISENGKYVYATNSSTVYQYTMSTPWDVSTLTYTRTATGASYSSSIELSEDGKNFFILNYANARLYNIPTTIPWDISGFTTSSYRTISEYSSPHCVRFGNNGAKMYMYSYSSDRLYQYTSDALLGTSFAKGEENTNNLANRLSIDNIFDTAENITINEKSDWYIPSKYEMDIIYRNLKPSSNNNVPEIESNIFSPEILTEYTLTVPIQTSSSLFKNSEKFDYSTTVCYFTSSIDSSGYVFSKSFTNGDVKLANDVTTNKLRLIRKIEY